MIKAIQAIQSIKKNPDSNFLLVGDNDFLYIYIKNLIKENNTDSLESITFDCSDKASVQDDILNSLSAIDLFQSKKIIIIKNINKVSKKNKDLFINALSNNENSNIIICTDNSFLGFDYKSKKNFIKSQFVNDITPFFHVIDISVPFESEMNKWIKVFSSDFDFPISNNIANNLIEIFGNNFSAIYNEISKLSVLADSVEDVNQDWLDSFYDWKKNKQALFFTKINNGTITDFSRNNLRGKIITKIPSSSEKYTLEEIERGINLLAGLDKKIKTRNIINESEFTNLVTQIYRYE